MWKFATIAGIWLLFGGVVEGVPEYASTIRPPAYPLAVRNPYTNVWLGADTLPGNWPQFWTTRIKAWTGLVRVDNATTYVWMGSPRLPDVNLTLAEQIGNGTVTPTQTLFHLKAGPLDLNVTFFSPVEVDDIPRQSIPLSYLHVSVASNDGASHNVQIYTDISAEWTTSDLGQVVNWTYSMTDSNTLKYFSSQQINTYRFGETDDFAGWGSAILAADSTATHKSGEDILVRGQFVSNGSLDNSNDPQFRCASCNWPTFAFSQNIGNVSGSSPSSAKFVVGHIREENVNWLGVPTFALWLNTWPNRSSLLDFFWSDFESSLLRADILDEVMLFDAFSAGGQGYADIIAYSLRQAYAGNEFSGGGLGNDAPIYYQKEISSGGFMQTVDVIYPSAPMFIYTNITYLRLLLEPLFYQMENGVWTRPFAMHDIGARYPNAVGQGYGGDMPIEESANMILMVGDIVFHPSTSPTDGASYTAQHFGIMSVWADYLLENCLYPVDQLSTDDFIGTTELNSGLALKGILGLATYAKLARLIGNNTEALKYETAVESYVPIWVNESLHSVGSHLKMEYNVSNGYQFKYNALQDHLLDLGVVPQAVYDMEANYYNTLMEPYGIPFVSTHDYTKSDWEMWTAAAFGDSNPTLKQGLIEGLANFLKSTPNRVPFTDWYVTSTARHVGFQARPVAGGHYALLAKTLMEQGRKNPKPKTTNL